MLALTALRLAVESWNGISGEDDSVSHDSGFFAGKYTGPFSADEVLEAILDPGEVDTIQDPEVLASFVGAIYTIDSQGFREVEVFTSKTEFLESWDDLMNEWGEWSYSVNAGHMVTIYSGAGDSIAFLQDEDGSKLADELAEMDECQVQETLRLYAC